MTRSAAGPTTVTDTPAPVSSEAPAPTAPAEAGPVDLKALKDAPGPAVLSAGWRGKVLAITAALALLAAALTYLELNAVRKDAARRLTDLEQSSARATEVALRADAEARAARERATVLEARVAEEQSQRESLEQLYADLSRGRDDAVLVEVERLIVLAAQELAISGNLNTALAALQTADVRLARTDSPRFVPLRRVLARDSERLKSAPSVDVTGIALKLDQLAAGADQWQLAADSRPLAAAGTTPKGDAGAAAEPGAPGAPAPARDRWEQLLERIQRELGEYRDLIQIRRVDAPDALWLSTAQQQLVRQQLKLRLLTARQALLARNDRLYRNDLGEAQALAARYFDQRQPAVAAALGQMKQLGGLPLSVEAQQINDSVAAVRAARTTPAVR